mgnify:CR=1 FL=1|jgi:hypothetical protein
MKINIFFIFLLFILSGCNTAKEAFTKKKNNNAQEFLVEKKSPLVMPPGYGELPQPAKKNNTKNTNVNIQELISGKITDTKKDNSQIESSIEKLILQKISKN